jgi:selenide,water dikinase
MDGISNFTDPRLLVGSQTADDAGVVRLDDRIGLVQTTDVFTPVVDDPYTFGQIVAANCMSDVWAMGGRVLSVLNLLGYPAAKVPPGIVNDYLKGCLDTVRESGGVLCGGHTWADPEFRAGMAVTGVIDPGRIVTNAGARPGDILVLTKPLGIGILTFAGTRGKLDSGQMEEVTAVMTTLNRDASEAMVEAGASACTDVTGFSLLGHAVEMARASRAILEMEWSRIPRLHSALDLAADNQLPLGESNKASFEPQIDLDASLSPEAVYLLFDPQTSGGLLIAVPKERFDRLRQGFSDRNITGAAVIGRVSGEGQGRVVIHKQPILTDLPNLSKQ